MKIESVNVTVCAPSSAVMVSIAILAMLSPPGWECPALSETRRVGRIFNNVKPLCRFDYVDRIWP
jgi:hypothetical protein